MNEDIEKIEMVKEYKKIIRCELDELNWQALLSPLPNGMSISDDPRSGILLNLSYLLVDGFDTSWVVLTAREAVQILRGIADAIETCTKRF